MRVKCVVIAICLLFLFCEAKKETKIDKITSNQLPKLLESETRYVVALITQSCKILKFDVYWRETDCYDCWLLASENQRISRSILEEVHSRYSSGIDFRFIIVEFPGNSEKIVTYGSTNFVVDSFAIFKSGKSIFYHGKTEADSLSEFLFR